jgi:recombination protein RecT
MSTGTAVATARPQNPIVAAVESRAEQFRALLPATVDRERFMRVFYDTLNRNPDVRKCSPQSVVDVCASAARDKLLLDGREAALVAYGTTAQYLPMVRGLRKLVFNTGLVSAMQTGIVYRSEIEGGRFKYVEGTKTELYHEPDLLLTDADRGAPVAVYSVVSMKDGSTSVEVMRWSEVKRIAKSTPIWKAHEGEMARKTVFRRHVKTLPFSPDLLTAVFAGMDEDEDTSGTADHEAPEPAQDAPQARRRGAAAAAVRAASIPVHDQDGVIEDAPPDDDADRDHLPTDDEVF